MAQYLFTVEMSCSGCSGAVERALGKLQGKNNNNMSDHHILGTFSHFNFLLFGHSSFILGVDKIDVSLED
ncbi:unnamed protein product [Absidia cylindrospora]